MRCSNGPAPLGAWRASATAAGVSGADAFLCHLSRSISAALECLAASAEAARVRLRAARDVIRGNDNPHFDELEARIALAESSKRIALERELCAVDAVLEVLRDKWNAATLAVAALSDAELLSQHAELVARLDDADAQLLALPTGVVEPPVVGLVVDDSALLANTAAFGRIIAPSAVTAADLALDNPLTMHGLVPQCDFASNSRAAVAPPNLPMSSTYHCVRLQ